MIRSLRDKGAYPVFQQYMIYLAKLHKGTDVHGRGRLYVRFINQTQLTIRRSAAVPDGDIRLTVRFAWAIYHLPPHFTADSNEISSRMHQKQNTSLSFLPIFPSQ